MAPNRTKPRPNNASHATTSTTLKPQPSHIPTLSGVSDFEGEFDSDAAVANTAALAASAAPTSRTNAELNLAVLQRHNPSITSVLSIAPYAVVYTFAPPTQSWEKSGVEGTLFVVQLAPRQGAAERFAVFVLNRRGLDNFFLELRAAADVELDDVYIILQEQGAEGESAIHGIWVFAEPPPSSTAEARSINAKLIQDCAVRAEASRVRVEEPQGHGQGGTGGQVGGVDMGRQLSLRELFGRAKTNGDPAGSAPLPQQQTQYWPQQPQASQAQQGHTGAGAGGDVLGELFRKARQGYNGTG